MSTKKAALMRKSRGNLTNFSYKLGFIGAGNMGKAIASGILSHGLLTENDILMSDINPDSSFGHEKIVSDAP